MSYQYLILTLRETGRLNQIILRFRFFYWFYRRYLFLVKELKVLKLFSMLQDLLVLPYENLFDISDILLMIQISILRILLTFTYIKSFYLYYLYIR